MKPRPNLERSTAMPRAMASQRRLKAALELGELGRALTLAGLRRRHPEESESEIQRLLRDLPANCHNRDD